MTDDVRLGIYVVDRFLEGRAISRHIVVARNVATAELLAIKEIGLDEQTYDRRNIEAGRLGDYNPGIAGASLTRSNAILAADLSR